MRNYPITIIMDRYSGVYSGGAWTAWPLEAGLIPCGPREDDVTCAAFWSQYSEPTGVGDTPTEAYENLKERMATK